jgi:hypothetical protein
MGWTIGVLGFDSRRRLGIFLFTTASRTALGPTQPPIHWLSGALSLGVKRLGCEADHSPPSSAYVKNAWSYTSTPQYVFMAWWLVKHRDFAFNFTFTLPWGGEIMKSFPMYHSSIPRLFNDTFSTAWDIWLRMRWGDYEIFLCVPQL